MYIALNDPSRPLRGVGKGNGQSISSTLNATFGKWRAALAGRWDRTEWDYTSQSSGSLAGISTLDPAANPFDGSLNALIPVNSRLSTSRNTTTQLTFDADGPLFSLWAGPLHGRVGLAANWANYDASDFSGPRALDRHEYSTKGAIGLRASVQNRGVRYLATGTMAAPDLLTYHAITTVDLKAFASLGQLLPSAKWAKDTRVTLAFDNLLKDRQRVEDLSGTVPQAYQPVRLDPVGRTVLLEIRKVF